MSKDDREVQRERLRLLHEAYEEVERIDGPVTLVYQRDPHGQVTVTVSPDAFHRKLRPDQRAA